ncbi:hypothetical protein L1S35_04135 [Flavobacterium sp. AS60]|uniref:hypothetical protein n=1 Tax=Flavobacterium anseongense TaxID=2910677 RepID=UPI001F2AE4F0|nr:hypothetical protein [Flavobacterium sp. AS60]MCF6128848.1 hypothetical protein [Flavobacterium sp. AS60]
MNLKIIFFTLLMTSNFVFSQEKVTETNEKEALNVTPTEETENGKIENGVYTCHRFDWKIKIPMNYEITDAKKIEELQKKGGLKQRSPHLIGFEVDKRNTFSATFESLEGSSIKSFEEHKNFMIKLLNDTYSNIETLKFELSSTDMKIGKYDFYKVQTRLYDPKTGELLLTQDLYNSFINNNLFSVNINFNNPNIGRLLTDNFISSLSN